MAMTIQEAVIIAAGTVIAPGGTEAVPVAAGAPAAVGPFADYANSFAYRITNGGTAPGSPLTIVFYGVAGGRLYEIDRVSGDSITNSTFHGVIPCPPGFASFTARTFGNSSQNVTAEVYLERQVP
jgi:hypothetical protein